MNKKEEEGIICNSKKGRKVGADQLKIKRRE
jgi:hypothetical protein